MALIGELRPNVSRDIIDRSHSPLGFCRMRMPDSETENSEDAGVYPVTPAIDASIHGATILRLFGRFMQKDEHEATLVIVPPDCEVRTVVDLVPSLKLQEWPTVVTEWKQKQRVWPPKDVVHEIVKAGCHLVVKSPAKMKIGLQLQKTTTKGDSLSALQSTGWPICVPLTSSVCISSSSTFYTVNWEHWNVVGQGCYHTLSRRWWYGP